MGRKPKTRNPTKNNNIVSACVDDFAFKEIKNLVDQSGLSRSQVIRKAIKAGLPQVWGDLPVKQIKNN